MNKTFLSHEKQPCARAAKGFVRVKTSGSLAENQRPTSSSNADFEGLMPLNGSRDSAGPKSRSTGLRAAVFVLVFHKTRAFLPYFCWLKSRAYKLEGSPVRESAASSAAVCRSPAAQQAMADCQSHPARRRVCASSI